MAHRTLSNTPTTTTMGREAPPAQAAADSRPGHKPGREGGGRSLAPALTALAACLFLFTGLFGARVAHAGPRGSVEKLRAVYGLDESLKESDGRLIRRKLLRLLARADVRLFLKVIQTAEGGEPDLMVGGCRARNLRQHPALVLPRSCWFAVKGWGFSSASGNYQITISNWKVLASFLELRDFSETSQALAALELIRRGGGAAGAYTPKGLALKQRIQGGFLKLLRGDLGGALCMSTHDWASSSCSTLPAGYKVVYARLADEIRKSRAESLRARQGKNGRCPPAGREKVKATLRLSGRAAEAAPSRKRATKAERSGARGKE
jgi:muramidase (phage lysozyme)